ncbi:hypothetical protein [Pseudoalteromonas sp. BDTF-M6]|uniref:DUF6950 family protein n=1 Tax=Pseudoalteromonas sp. BDTF-M6 TaxID=2796132 RepID=UPI0032D59CA1
MDVSINVKFHDFITARTNMPFEWGINDCCLFVADWVECATGHDPAFGCRDAYSTQAGAFKHIFKLGFKDVRSVFKDRLNTPVPVHYARRGDLALVEDNGELIGGIIGVGSVYCVCEEGLVSLPMDRVAEVFPLEARSV